jgi:hypothetical protein
MTPVRLSEENTMPTIDLLGCAARRIPVDVLRIQAEAIGGRALWIDVENGELSLGPVDDIADRHAWAR